MSVPKWLAVLCATVCIASLALPAAAQAQVQLATLDIAIWPEFDRPAVLVIYSGQLAADTPLPADVSLRIPASALEGKPHAVAVSDPAQGLLNLPYTTQEAGQDWLRISFSTPHPAFQLEFYDTLDVSRPERRYHLSWPGDLEVAGATLQIQQPFGAQDLRVSPAVEAGYRRDDGLLYHPADLGRLQAGQALTVEIVYRKEDARTSAEALSLVEPTPLPQPTPVLAAPASSGLPAWLIAGVVAGLVLIVAGLIWQLLARGQDKPIEYIPSAVRRDKRGQHRGRGHAVARRKPQPEPERSFCTQCGQELDADEAFCTRCGARRTPR